MKRAFHIGRQSGAGPICRRNVAERYVIPFADMFEAGPRRAVSDRWVRGPSTARRIHAVTYRGETRPGCVSCWQGWVGCRAITARLRTALTASESASQGVAGVITGVRPSRRKLRPRKRNRRPGPLISFRPETPNLGVTPTWLPRPSSRPRMKVRPCRSIPSRCSRWDPAQPGGCYERRRGAAHAHAALPGA